MFECTIPVLINGRRIRAGEMVDDSTVKELKEVAARHFAQVTKPKDTTEQPLTVSDIAMQRQYKSAATFGKKA